MKKTLVIAFAMLTGFVMQAQLVFNSGIEYNDYIVAEQTKVGELIIKLTNNMDVEEKIIRANHAELLAQAKVSLENVKKMGPFKNNSALRDASVNLFAFYVDIITNEYASMIDLLLKPDFDEEDLTAINGYLNKITEREAGLDEIFAAAQQQFANENGFSLYENELQEEIDQLGEQDNE